MGSVKNIDGVNLPIEDKIVSNQLDTFKKTLSSNLGNGEFAFKWANKSSAEIIRTPTRAHLIDKLSEVSSSNSEDIFLFYYFGHGYVNQDKNLCLSFNGFSALNNLSHQFTINQVVDEIKNRGFKKIILILDCCYAGINYNSLNDNNIELYILSASYNNWSTFDNGGGTFSKALINVLKDPLVEKYIQQGSEEFTLDDWFNGALSFINNQTPTATTNLRDISIKPHNFLKYLSPSFNKKAPIQSVYYKLFLLLTEVIGTNAYSTQIIYTEIIRKRLQSFRIVNNANNQEVYVSLNKTKEYLETLKNLKLIEQNANQNWLLTSQGIASTRNDGMRYNELLMNNLFNWLAKETLNDDSRMNLWKDVRNTFKSLISTFQIPNVINFEKEFFRNSESRTVDRNELKTILQLLSFTEVLKRVDSHTYFI